MKSDDFGCRPPEPLLCDPGSESDIAIDNAIILREKVFELAQSWNGSYFFDSVLVCEFNEIAMSGIYACAGNFRDRYSAPAGLSAPNHRAVPSLVDEMCDYANSHRDSPFHAAAYLLWRINWIHPFYDGNGRVSRELCHLAVLVETGNTWQRPLPAFIADAEDRYIEGLQIADRSWDGETSNVAELQSWIAELYIEHNKFPDD